MSDHNQKISNKVDFMCCFSLKVRNLLHLSTVPPVPEVSRSFRFEISSFKDAQ